MDLIVLKGNSDVGKTTTINIVYQLLLTKGYKQVPNCFQDLGNGDFLDVIENGIQKVGIVSQGDYAIGSYSVGNHLFTLQNAGSNKAICACTNGKPKIINAINKYTHTSINKTSQTNVSLQRIDNNYDALKIMLYV